MIIPAVGSLASELTSAAAGPAGHTAQTQGVGTLEGAEPASGGSGGSSGSFGNALTEAISSLEGSQLSSDAASQSLAAGTVSDPEAAVTTVEDAALEMQLAAQIRTKATEAVQTIFQTQV